jgi:RepB DNA-primase from phage plasmid
MTDRETARHFLSLAFEPDDWVAVFLKAYDTGRVMQRVAPLSTFCEPRSQTWLRVMNAYRFNVYVSVNAMTPGLRERTKQAVSTVRHVFLDVDEDAESVVERLATRNDVPAPSYLVHSSPGRLQLLWRVWGFTGDTVERLQKQLARELGADPAATACSQTMRVPGFLNRKHSPAPVVTVEYRAASVVYGPGDFPAAAGPPDGARERFAVASLASGVDTDIVERARRYLAAVPPAVAGRHGDAQTFRVCCRLARGFPLDTGIALQAIVDWNARCEPPWSVRELIAKLDHAKRYGREPIGGLHGAER